MISKKVFAGAALAVALLLLGATVTSTSNGPDFGPQVTYPAGGGAQTVAVGDLDADGHLDLVTAKVVLLNEGDGTFATPVNYSDEGCCGSVHLGDMDADGDLDLAGSNTNGVSVLLNHGDGTFASPVNYDLERSGGSLAIGDLDGDGDLDLVSASRYGDNISVLFNQSDGTFADRADYPVGDEPLSVAVSDLDGDGDLDLVVGNRNDNNVSVLLNNGGGAFAGHVTYGVGSWPYSVAIGDIDRDGDQDLIVANRSGGNISVWLNQGDGTFADRVDYVVGSGPKFVALGDLDLDGDLDLATANQHGDSVSVLLNQGDGTFTGRTDYGVGDCPHMVVMGDLDGDWDLDLVTGNQYTDDVSVLMNHLSTPTTVESVTLTPPSPVKVETVEFEVTFSEEMNTSVVPTVTIGIDVPYNDYTIAPKTGTDYTNGYLNADTTKWYGTCAFTDTMHNGTYHISISGAEGSSGNQMQPDTSETFVLDTVAPDGSLIIDNGAAYATTTSVTLTTSATDATSGVAQMQLSNDGISYDPWESYAGTKSWTLSSGDGLKTVYVKYKDNAGNVSTPYTDTITLDTTVQPAYGLSINEGALFTDQITVILTLPANPHTAQMMISNDGGFVGAQWEPYATHKEWQITQHGADVIPRTVYAKYKDAEGVVSSVYQDDIVLDVSEPTKPIGGIIVPIAKLELLRVNLSDLPVAVVAALSGDWRLAISAMIVLVSLGASVWKTWRNRRH